MSDLIFNTNAHGAERYIERVESDDPIIRAAFNVAQKAHHNQLRSERTEAPYIVHPIMAYNMLRDFGVSNSLTLAGMLLHDALEDCPDYQPTRDDKLAADLCSALKAEGVCDAEEIGHFIVESLCLPLTNPSKMMEGKRSHQVQHAGAMSSRVALLKIVDQASSVLDSILVEDEGISVEKKREWNYKALDVVKSAVSDRESLYYWGNLFKVLFTYNMEMLDAQEAGHSEQVDYMRKHFSYEKAKEQAWSMPAKEDAIDCGAKTVGVADTETLEKGCLNVQLNNEGQVCGYHVLVNQLADRADPRNACSIDLMGRIERHSRTTRVTTGTPEVESGRLVRVNMIKPAIALDEFCALAKKSGAISLGFGEILKREAQMFQQVQLA